MASPRRNLAAFAELIGRPLTDWQARALDLRSAITCIVAGRGMGKSRSLAVLAAWYAFRRRSQAVLVVSASEASARRLLAEVRGIAATEPLRGSVVDEQAALVRLTNGSAIRSVPSSERTIRGNVCDLLLVDEAAFVPDELLYGAAYPTTAAREGRIVLASSAGVAAGAFYDEATRGETGAPQRRTHRWVARAAGGSEDAPWITPSVVERDRESLGELRFRAEYMATFASGADSLFSREALDRATADYLPDELAAMLGPARVVAGQDWGATTDRSALAAVGRLPVIGEGPVLAVRCARRWPAGAPLAGVVEEVAASPACFDTIAAEINGLGAPCAEMLWTALRRRPLESGGGRPRPRVVAVGPDAIPDPWNPPPPRRPVERPDRFVTRKVPVHVSAEGKAATYSALRLLVDRGLLLLPAAAEELRRELLMLRVDLTATGTERIEAASGHDDLADALALSLIPYRTRRGEWRTLVGDLAERRGATPATALTAGAVFRTADGLEVPARPAWQSVAGAELTLPPGHDPAPPHSREARRIAAEVIDRRNATRQEATHAK